MECDSPNVAHHAPRGHCVARRRRKFRGTFALKNWALVRRLAVIVHAMLRGDTLFDARGEEACVCQR
jgi:hypothetical protein